MDYMDDMDDIMVGIVDYSAGNTGSVSRAIGFLGGRYKIVRESSDLYDVDKLILPGVGSFGKAVERMKENELYDEISRWIKSNKPLLGICLGMQLLFEGSDESPDAEGFSLFKGRCSKFDAKKVPLIGWGSIELKRDSKLFKDVPDGSFFYFLHSYYAPSVETDALLATNSYGVEYCCAAFKGSIFGVQFHPEKSGEAGLKVIGNWMEV